MDGLQTIAFWFGLIADTIAFFGIPYTVLQLYYNRKKEKQMNQEVGIQLKCDETNRTITLPAKLPRRNFTRAELLGLLGMAQKQGDRFSLNYLKTHEFIQELQRIQNSSQPETLIIPCGRDKESNALEIKQFEIKSSIINPKS